VTRSRRLADSLQHHLEAAWRAGSSVPSPSSGQAFGLLWGSTIERACRAGSAPARNTASTLAISSSVPSNNMARIQGHPSAAGGRPAMVNSVTNKHYRGWLSRTLPDRSRPLASRSRAASAVWVSGCSSPKAVTARSDHGSQELLLPSLDRPSAASVIARRYPVSSVLSWAGPKAAPCAVTTNRSSYSLSS
jgi:hypothetical protein